LKVKYHEIELDWRVELVLNALFYFEKCEEKKIVCDFNKRRNCRKEMQFFVSKAKEIIF